MRPAADRLSVDIGALEIGVPQVPVVHNVHAQSESEPQRIGALLVEQIYSPVQWAATINKLVAAGVDTIIECGPGKVLAGLCKRIDRNLNCLGLETPDGLTAAVATVNGNVA